MEAHAYDVVVIGGGPAGMSGANTAGRFGRRVALVEKVGAIGRAAINTGTNTHNRRDRQEQLRRNNFETFHGAARFIDANIVQVGADTLLRGEKILIATGSSPVRPAEFRFADPRVHDSDAILGIRPLPKTLAVIGAGVIAAEYACNLAAVGVQVHLIDARDSLLGVLDREISENIEHAMTAGGVHFIWNEKVIACEAPPTGDLTLTLTSGATLNVTDVLVAGGRQSNTGNLNLTAAGLTPGERGVLNVDAQCRTEVPHIFAAGDVTGPPVPAATAMEQARIAMSVALDRSHKDVIAPILPTAIYAIPEASTAGETEESLKSEGVAYVVGRARYTDNRRGGIVGNENGLLKLIFARDDMRLRGVHVVGDQATELVHIGLVAMMSGSGAELLSRTCFNYPALGNLYKRAASEAMRKRDGIVRHHNEAQAA